jgi:hypothetical protein
MNVTSTITKDYVKHTAFAARKNKANSKPILKSSNGESHAELEYDCEKTKPICRGATGIKSVLIMVYGYSDGRRQ